jgi:hypothetical protein
MEHYPFYYIPITLPSPPTTGERMKMRGLFLIHPHPNPLPPAGEGETTDFNRVVIWSQLKHVPWPTLNRLGVHF